MSTEKTFSSGEITVNYYEGPPTGPPLLLLHGLTSRWQDWQVLLPILEPKWHVYAADLRGHGKSSHIGDYYSLNEYAGDIIIFIREQIGEPVVLIGHSLGAMTAIAVAAEAPEQVRAAVLLDPPIYVGRAGIEGRADVKGWFNFVHQLTSTAQSREDYIAGVRAMMGPDVPDEAVAGLAEHLSHVAPGTVGTTLRDELLGKFELASTLPRITSPMLLLRGEWNLGGAIREEDAEFVMAHLPGVTSILVPGTGHALHAEQTDLVMQHIDLFLQAALDK